MAENETDILRNRYSIKLKFSDIDISSIATHVDDISIIDLLLAARQAAKNSYAPYSKYHVGSCILLPNNEIISGWNVENKEYSATICAESAAIARLDLEQRKKVLAISVYSPSSLPNPCGSCRQRIFELGNSLLVIIGDGKGEIKLFSSESLFPYW